MTAVGDYFADSITAENPPVDFKSPIRRKSDVNEENKINTGQALLQQKDANANTPAEGENAEETASVDSDAEGGAEESPAEEAPTSGGEDEELPTFGLT